MVAYKGHLEKISNIYEKGRQLLMVSGLKDETPFVYDMNFIDR